MKRRRGYRPGIAIFDNYSRKFETAADGYALGLLKRNGYSPAALGYFSTHPLTKERTQRARNAEAP